MQELEKSVSSPWLAAKTSAEGPQKFKERMADLLTEKLKPVDHDVLADLAAHALAPMILDVLAETVMGKKKKKGGIDADDCKRG